MHGYGVFWLLLLLLHFTSWAVALERVFLWPIPQHVVSGNVDLKLDPSFHIRGPDEIQDAIKRCMNTILADRWIPVQVPLEDDDPTLDEQQPHFNTNNENKQHVFVNNKANTLSTLEVSIDDVNAKLEFGVDESYTLDISDKGSATLAAKTKWGALYGLETFSQLVQAYKTSSSIEDYDDQEEQGFDTSVENLFIPETPIHIEDAPAYSHRGLMLDTARNYFPVMDILRMIDGMAYNKMNVFHWHITDSQSFPLRLESIPELAEHGAYVLGQRRLVYNKKDVERVVDYARARGVRVIPEIDMPAHTASWSESHKEITTCAGRFFLDPDNKGQYAAQPTTGQLNPVLEETYHLVEKAISEVASLFPDAWYHGGGDEPFYKCWEQDAHVQHYMKTHNATGDDLLYKFLKREIEFIRESEKTPVLWEDPVTINNLELKDVVLQVWINPVQQAVKKGYKVIASHAQFWYLDCGKGGWTGNDTSYDEQVPPEIPDSLAEELERYQVKDNYRPSNWGGSGNDWCSPFKTWQRIYSYDMAFNLTQEEAKLVLGGEVALWTEQTDPVGMDTRLWPRTAAAAEVLWSGRYDDKGHKRDLGNAMLRIFDWRYRLVKRGIQAEALQPLWCGKNPRMCDSQYPEAFLQDRHKEGAIKHSVPGAINVDEGDQ